MTVHCTQTPAHEHTNRSQPEEESKNEQKGKRALEKPKAQRSTRAAFQVGRAEAEAAMGCTHNNLGRWWTASYLGGRKAV